MTKPTFTEAELSIIATSIRDYLESLMDIDGDDSLLFALRDTIDVYEKVADYKIEEMN